jgi:hypothetical protein
MFARGFKEPLSHPTKGGIRHNILEWTSLGFTSRAWSPIKQMLEEERSYCAQVVQMFLPTKNGGNM